MIKKFKIATLLYTIYTKANFNLFTFYSKFLSN